jgi:protein gp37
LDLAARLKAMGNPSYQIDGGSKTSGPGFGVALHPEKLGDPLKWKKPKMVFVNSMSDLWHPKVPDDFIQQMFDVMRDAPQHTFQILTKRPRRMASFLQRYYDCDHGGSSVLSCRYCEPLPNVWLGVSVENQRWADQRIPLLMETPTVVRFLSCEPLLGPVDIAEFLTSGQWCIVGGESGIQHRTMDLAWARRIVEQCQAAGVACFVKQDSGLRPGQRGRLPDDLWAVKEWPESVGTAPGQAVLL